MNDSAQDSIAAPDCNWQKVRWIKDVRYYEAHLHQDLWDGWVLTRVWGTIGAANGRVVHTPCDSYSAGVSRLGQIAQRRKQHGYRN